MNHWAQIYNIRSTLAFRHLLHQSLLLWAREVTKICIKTSKWLSTNTGLLLGVQISDRPSPTSCQSLPCMHTITHEGMNDWRQGQFHNLCRLVPESLTCRHVKKYIYHIELTEWKIEWNFSRMAVIQNILFYISGDYVFWSQKLETIGSDEWAEYLKSDLPWKTQVYNCHYLYFC